MTPNVAEALRVVASRKPLPRALAEATFGDLMDGQATEAQKGALLLGIATRGETADEIAGAVVGAAAAHAARHDAARAAAGHVRPRRPGPRPVQPLDGGGGRRRRRGRLRRQARQPLDLLPRRLRRRPRRRAASTIELDARQAGRVLDEVGLVFLFAPVVPSGDEGARHRSPRARHPDDLQRARPAREPGGRDPAAHRRRPARARAAAGGRARLARQRAGDRLPLRERARRARPRRRRMRRRGAGRLDAALAPGARPRCGRRRSRSRSSGAATRPRTRRCSSASWRASAARAGRPCC